MNSQRDIKNSAVALGATKKWLKNAAEVEMTVYHMYLVFMLKKTPPDFQSDLAASRIALVKLEKTGRDVSVARSLLGSMK